MLVPLIGGTIVLVHGENGWRFTNKDGGWEYPTFCIVRDESRGERSIGAWLGAT